MNYIVITAAASTIAGIFLKEMIHMVVVDIPRYVFYRCNSPKDSSPEILSRLKEIEIKLVELKENPSYILINDCKKNVCKE